MKNIRCLYLATLLLLTACSPLQTVRLVSSPQQPLATNISPTSAPLPAKTQLPPTQMVDPSRPDPAQPTQPQVDPTLSLPTEIEATRSPTQAPATDPQTVRIYLIAIGDNGASGEKIGCGDSLVPVDMQIPHTQGVLRAALEALLSNKDQFYGQSGLYNSLYQSDIQVESVKIENGVATIQLTGTLQLGGECDNPRVLEQVRATALQFSTVQRAEIYLNVKTLEEALSLK